MKWNSVFGICFDLFRPLPRTYYVYNISIFRVVWIYILYIHHQSGWCLILWRMLFPRKKNCSIFSVIVVCDAERLSCITLWKWWREWDRWDDGEWEQQEEKKGKKRGNRIAVFDYTEWKKSARSFCVTRFVWVFCKHLLNFRLIYTGDTHYTHTNQTHSLPLSFPPLLLTPPGSSVAC